MEGPLAPLKARYRWVKILLLWPIGWILTQTFFTVFTRAALYQQFWATEEFWFFHVGILLWLVAFLGLPRPLWIYVFGHELTHALWVWIQGGKVSALKITPAGGYILANRLNIWIALAPYFFPLYTLGIMGIYGLLSLVYDLSPFRYGFYMLVGATWAFHVTFTLWMLSRGQSDLLYGGLIYSLLLIYVMNLLMLSFLLILAVPNMTSWEFGKEFVVQAQLFVKMMSP